MLGRTDSFRVAYNSDLIIRDRAEAATLCVFYDQVFLPHTTANSRKLVTGTDGSNKWETVDCRDDIKDWELEYGALFKAGVIQRMPEFVLVDEYEQWEDKDVYEKPQGPGIPDDLELHSFLSGDCRLLLFRPASLPYMGTIWDTVKDGDKVLSTETRLVTVRSPNSELSDCNVKYSRIQRKMKRKRTRTSSLSRSLLLPCFPCLFTKSRQIKPDSLGTI
jgi:hypothetical protein